MCIDGTGKVARVDPIESTGIPGFDVKIRAALQTWTYKPYAPAGEPLEACTLAAGARMLARERGGEQVGAG